MNIHKIQLSFAKRDIQHFILVHKKAQCSILILRRNHFLFLVFFLLENLLKSMGPGENLYKKESNLQTRPSEYLDFIISFS